METDERTRSLGQERGAQGPTVRRCDLEQPCTSEADARTVEPTHYVRTAVVVIGLVVLQPSR
jgi:hypothetical protein